jgi:N-acetylglucosaminyldiphosphoundecaprenol N-acetyl-beta-D-mannosaminyltransferase
LHRRTASAAGVTDFTTYGLSGGQLTALVQVGVRAAFDFHAGFKPQAPRWMQRFGLEWLFRLAAEPRRLWRKDLFNNPLVLIVVVRALGL